MANKAKARLEVKNIEGFRRVIHRMLREADVKKAVVVRFDCDGGWGIFTPNQTELRDNGTVGFVVKVLRKKYPKKIINHRAMSRAEEERGLEFPDLKGYYSRV